MRKTEYDDLCAFYRGLRSEVRQAQSYVNVYDNEELSTAPGAVAACARNYALRQALLTLGGILHRVYFDQGVERDWDHYQDDYL